MSRVKNRLLRGGSLGVLAFLLSFVVGVPSAVAQGNKEAMSPKEAQQRLRASSKSFLENKGQWDQRAKFLARTPNLNVWVTSGGLLFDQYRVVTDKIGDVGRKGHVVAMLLKGANKAPAIKGEGIRKLRTDFIVGDPKDYITGVRSYNEVLMSDVYKGIDVRNYFDQGQLRYDFIVHPGADHNKIRFELQGADSVSIDKKGDLIIGTSLGKGRQAGLYAYQIKNGKKQQVPARFAKIGKNLVAFKVGKYDHSKPLIIDPLVYGSYYGGDEGWDEVRSVVADADGGVFITGGTMSGAFPNIAGPYGFVHKGEWDAYVSKFQGDAYSHDYCAFVGGSLGEVGDSIQLDPFGDVWVAGRTESSNFPGNTRKNVQYLRQISASDADGGQFRLRYRGNFTAQLPWDATAAQVEAALEALPGMAGLVDATGGPMPDQIRIELDNSEPFRIEMWDNMIGQNGSFIEGIEPNYIVTPQTPSLTQTISRIVGSPGTELEFAL